MIVGSLYSHTWVVVADLRINVGFNGSLMVIMMNLWSVIVGNSSRGHDQKLPNLPLFCSAMIRPIFGDLLA
mgnify:CR=1 FL=1